MTPVEPVDLPALAAWTGRLAALPSAGRWGGGDRAADGSLRMPWYDYDPEVLLFTGAAAAAGFVQPVDWMTWAGTPRGLELARDPAAVATADTGELVFLMTSIVRGDRFSEGTIADAFKRGVLLAVCRRADALVHATRG